MSKKISAVICTYNRYDLLDKAIRSCLEQTLPAEEYEVIVVDNSPASSLRAGSVEKYREDPFVRYLTEDIPGLSNARNVAAKAADSPFVAYLDDDAVADPEWLKSILVAFAKFGPIAAIVGGRIDPIWEAPRPRWLPDELLGVLTVVNWGGSMRVAKPTEWIAGANISFRVSALQEVGGFNVALGRNGSGAMLLSNEESGVVDKLKQAGYELIYAPEARVDHLVDQSRVDPAWIRRRQAWQAVSDFIKSPQQFEGKEKAYWGVVARFMSKSLPRHRTPAGLFADVHDRELYHEQVRATYCLVSLLLMGSRNVEDFDLEV
jgi:glycosyltransferase involved in cell wall biosynthesis